MNAGYDAYRLESGRRMVLGGMAFVADPSAWTVAAPVALETGVGLLRWRNVVPGMIGLAVAALVVNVCRGGDAPVAETTSQTVRIQGGTGCAVH